MTQQLPKLNQVEEMLIARAQVYVEAKRIRDHQYQCTYGSYCILCFMNNTTKLYAVASLASWPSFVAAESVFR